MTAQITRALLCFMMLLTGLSAAAEAAFPDLAQTQSAEEQLLPVSLIAATAASHLAGHIAAINVVALNSVAIIEQDLFYNMSSGAFTFSSPLSRKDSARE
jgi:hypothetical protein